MDAVFPADVFHRLGYAHQMLSGQPMHHGVAILSKVPLIEDNRHNWQDNGEARHIGARLPNGVRLENVYVPADGIKTSSGHASFADVAQALVAAIDTIAHNPAVAAGIMGAVQAQPSCDLVLKLEERAVAHPAERTASRRLARRAGAAR